ncbi:MAG TPA: DUF2630 family protein [Solirubrobacteraceae bacterium]|nr:DUF2630 family protein [Solirubrobacteraceae bacterium]
MDDRSIHQRIEDLVSEEERLLGSDHGLGPDEHDRLATVKVELDRYWDLLRQRRARREAGLDPDQASIRDADTVEGYEQ